MAALFGAVDRSLRMSSAVFSGFRWPKWSLEVSIASWSNSSSSKMLWRVGSWGGVECGARFGAGSPVS
jgi:hypothetical protein